MDTAYRDPLGGKRRSTIRLPKKMQTVGQEGMLTVDGVQVSVIIIDARLHIEAVDYLIEPTAGKGRMWIDSELIKIVDPLPKPSGLT